MTCTVRVCVISATQRIPRGPVLRPSWTVLERLTRGGTTAHKLGVLWAIAEVTEHEQ
jgi:hypothetical protein